MIEPMKKVFLVCLEEKKDASLQALRALAVMHLTFKNTASETGDAVRFSRLWEAAEKGVNLLSETDAPGELSGKLPETGKEVMEQLNALLEEKEAVRKTMDKAREDRDQLLPWGNFEPAAVKALEEKGIHLIFCRTFRKEPLPQTPEGGCLLDAGISGSYRYFVLGLREKSEPGKWPEVRLPDRSLAETEKVLKEGEETLVRNSQRLAELTEGLPLLKKYAAALQEQAVFAKAFASMEEAGKLAFLTGYVPEDRLDALREAAQENGWALLIHDADPDDDNVPTCIRKPRWMDIMDPLFDFIGVTPGYREHDVTLFFLLFFPVFFGMIVGDAAYGVLFLLLAFAGKYLFRKKPEARLPLNLFILLGSASLIWGWLNGSWFGLPVEILPEFMQGLDFLADPQSSPCACRIAAKYHVKPEDMGDRAVQFFCFLIAAVHISLARIFKFVCDIRQDWREVGNLGWALLTVGNFFLAVHLIVFPGFFPGYAYWLYGAGLVLIVVTTRLRDAFNLPCDVIGTFVDVLSYIRLFAVGLSGAYIASSFNTMALPLLQDASGFQYALAVTALVLIAAIGHLMNIALGFLSVLVHGVRLNTLEFSKNCGLQWSGIQYEPFKTTTHKE